KTPPNLLKECCLIDRLLCTK
ncbi:hypothetical protein TNCT_347961, partial [Trichonephila clavata]